MTVNLEATETDLPTVLRQIEQRVRAQQALRDIDGLSKKLDLGPFNFEEFKADRDNGRR